MVYSDCAMPGAPYIYSEVNALLPILHYEAIRGYLCNRDHDSIAVEIIAITFSQAREFGGCYFELLRRGNVSDAQLKLQ